MEQTSEMAFSPQGTFDCPTGGTYPVQATLVASDGTTQIGPVTTTYFDQLGRTITPRASTEV
jgi:hypothetical protein